MSCLGPVFCHGCARGCQERGGLELRLNTFNSHIETQIAGDRYTHREMTLILDKDTGNTEDL